MVRSRPHLPQGHGEVLTRPEYGTWEGLARQNARQASTFGEVAEGATGTLSLPRLRRDARRQVVAEAVAYSRKLGVPLLDLAVDPSLVLLTGHQPELFHPGIWSKHFLLDRLAEESGGIGIDLVVDTDAFDAVGFSVLCTEPDAVLCRHDLVAGGSGATYATTAVPDAGAIEFFCESASAAVATLPAPAIARHLDSYCDALRGALADAETLGDVLTIARRRFEAPAKTRYLELPVSIMARCDSFLTFVAHIALDAERFARDHNTELAEYRLTSRTRSSAQPFPDLDIESGLVELPFWFLSETGRVPARVRSDPAGAVEILADSVVVAGPASDAATLVEALRRSPLLAPRALTLTMFTRLFVGDLFVHGVGGGRYDAVTDGVIRRFFGVEAPAFVVASLTMYLPLGAHVVTEEEVARAKRRLHRLEHNPEEFLAEAVFETPAERKRAVSLAARKRSLLEAISDADADKKALGAEIREVNRAIAELLQPVSREMESEYALLSKQLKANEILTDRSYPFFLWHPLEVQDKVR